MWGSLLRCALTTFLAALVAFWGLPAAADTVIADGDVATPFAATPVSFGTVCLGQTVVKPVLVGLQRSGPVSGGEVFANGTVVQFMLVSATGSGYFTSPSLPPTPPPGFPGAPFSGMTVPANWATQPDLTIAGPNGAFLVIVSPTQLGAVSGQVNLAARGLNAAGTMITRPGSVSITGTVTNCQDTTPPVLSVPTSFDVEATSPAGATVTYPASATDQNPTHPEVSCTPASGSTFGFGTTTVHCSTQDAAGNPAEKSFEITVRDTAAPVIGAVTDLTVEAVSADGATVTYTAPTAVDTVDGERDVTCTPSSGTTFGLGVTPVVCTASDTRGNSRSRTFLVHVEDTTSPVLLLPGAVTAEATDADGALVEYVATAEDAVDGPKAPSCTPTSGSRFPLGETTVTCAVTDAAGHTTTGTFLVRVADTTPPQLLDVPTQVTAEATSSDGAAVTYAVPTAHDSVDGPVEVNCVPPPGATFPIGTSVVRCTAADAAGNVTARVFAVGVLDTTGPELTLPADTVVEASGPSGATVQFAATATDLVDGDVAPECDRVSDSTFQIGTTTVHCTATDAAGNKATGSFQVTVRRTIDGFASPVDGQRIFNTVKAGRTVPLKFEVFAGATELTSTQIVRPLTVRRYNCDPNAPQDAVEVTTTGNTELRYDAAAGQFVFNWKTPGERNLCYRVDLSTTDGATVTALFRTT
jgi:hypothetical protein